jgi:hypothetical protein
MTGELLALDPSINSSGVALFRDGALVACGRITDPHPSDGIGARALAMAELVRDWFSDENDLGANWRVFNPSRVTLVVEWQQVYRAGRSKGDPNDLLGMGFVSGAVAGLLQPAAVLAYKPDEWCKLPKYLDRTTKRIRHRDAFVTPRGLRIMSRLSDAERELVPQYHDAVDAAGLGLHALGRLEPRRVFHGAS